MQIVEKRVLGEAEYLAFEETAPLRHEFMGGEVYAMSGGTLRHNRISLNTASLLLARLVGKPCQVFVHDVKLHVARDRAYYYPDVMVTCAEQASAANESQVVNDPVLVVEVLSPSAEGTDRREKLAAYRHHGDINWLYITFEPGDTVEFTSVGLSLPIAELYAGTDIVL